MRCTSNRIRRKGEVCSEALTQLAGWVPMVMWILLAFPVTAILSFEEAAATPAATQMAQIQGQGAREFMFSSAVGGAFDGVFLFDVFPEESFILLGRLVIDDSARGGAEAQYTEYADMSFHHRCSEGGCASLGCCLVFENDWRMEILPPSLPRMALRLASVTEFILPADTRPPIPAI